MIAGFHTRVASMVVIIAISAMPAGPWPRLIESYSGAAPQLSRAVLTSPTGIPLKPDATLNSNGHSPEAPWLSTTT